MTTPQPYPGMPSQPAPQGFPYPPQPPAKKKRKWPVIVGGVVALIIVGSMFNDDKKDTKAESTTTVAQAPAAAPTEPAPTEEAPKPAATLNTPVRDGKFEFVVRSVQPGLSEIGDNPFLNQKAQGQFVIVTLSVQNIGDRPQGFSPSNQKLVDTEGDEAQRKCSELIGEGAHL
ncbi:DUF4352 domain-containing protein [Mycolicibacterium goodii]|uniref:DUF4352 domain-containing protein n=1 Tax=Mycolicibacterium goodii TaxID=134601 RepID=UPI001F0381D3|nr:DUF4352 domain-containing protein [Mycolicibacterium goodii]ULN48876.1 DUF4352 domain-containing protein [Mycolicibacterium goodii]